MDLHLHLPEHLHLHEADDPADRHADDVLAVRAWARSRGYPIDETSGVPREVLRTYRRVRTA